MSNLYHSFLVQFFVFVFHSKAFPGNESQKASQKEEHQSKEGNSNGQSYRPDIDVVDFYPDNKYKMNIYY